MAKKVRKQIYIHQRQQALLKKLSELRGTSEAEVIRKALDHELQGGAGKPQPDPQAWERAYQLMMGLHAQGPLESQPRDWTRNDLYEERVRISKSDSAANSCL
jgi:hypothetical protein